ncbi:FkbO/Hyg5 family chorismatase [Saccharopolyspora sp. ASAGF58]|uniref:FkbO/Hyg5 family chorismatase n=1 Tax=Saccharopolyspora sp. ASAGF58 TaxID=2719023 RepID=UPI001FF098F2|nr:FkbO/Hyg5 family chorismatase [Saccharopolyspora sp. ASAGF58]
MTYSPHAPAVPPERVLGVVRHAVVTEEPVSADPWPSATVHTAASPDQAFHEIWTSTRTVNSGRYRNLIYGHDGETLFCAAEIPDAERFRDAVRQTYDALVELVQGLGYRLFRVWNHIANINADNADGLERYRDFCKGRAEALEHATRDWIADLPAASGVGALGGGVVMYCLASRTRTPVHFENPRQIPAYHYPRQYGPRSPTFARASLLPCDTGTADGLLYVSGTASVVGHETVCVGDLKGQCRTTVENLDHLLKHVGEQTNTSIGLADFRFAKLYVRHAADVPFVAEEFRRTFGSDTALQVLGVDICRSDLLVEVEGVVTMA